ncbi:MAG: FtsX-like permease family protein [Bdellovibrionota bacterium]
MLTRLTQFLYSKEAKVDKSLFLLALSLSCGIAALVALETFSRRVEGTVNRDSKKVLAADYQIRSWRPFDEKVMAAIKEERESSRTVLLKDFVSSLRYDVAGTAQTTTVSVRSIEGDAYPFYGDYVTEPVLSMRSLREQGGVVLDKSFRARGVALGDFVELGEARLKVVAFLEEEPQAVMGAFSLGPRVILPANLLESTNLLRTGSRVLHQMLVKSDLDSATFEKKFRSVASDLHWRLITPEKSNRQVERVLDRMRGFLSFVGIASLFLGAMGLFMVFRSQFLQKLPSYLTLRCIGAKRKDIVQLALMSSMQVAFYGSFIGIFLGLSVEFLLVFVAKRYFQVDLGSASWVPSFAWGFLLSLLSVGVAVLLPLRELLRVPVSNAIRQEEASSSTLKGSDAFIAFLVATLVVFLVGPKFEMSLAILLGIVVASFLLLVSSAGILAMLWTMARTFVLKHAYLQLQRKKSRTQLLILSFGMSLFFLYLVLFLGASLRSQLESVQRKDIPNVFALNVSAEAQDKLSKILPEAIFVPVAQARIVELKGKELLEREVPDEGAERFYQTREYVVTKRAELSNGEELLAANTLFGEPIKDRVRISVEQNFADRLKVTVGDELKLDFAGVRLSAVIRSIRKVNWFNFQPNFFIVFSPEDIEGAPMDFVALSRVPSAEIAAYQMRVAKELPQVSLVDGEALASRLTRIISQLSLAVYSVTLFSIVACFFVFVGIFLARKKELIKELALWRCLGLRRGRIQGIYVAESLFVGLLASLTALFSASLVVTVLCKWVIDIPVHFASTSLLVSLLILPALFCVLGVWLLLRGSLSQSTQALFRLAEESY